MSRFPSLSALLLISFSAAACQQVSAQQDTQPEAAEEEAAEAGDQDWYYSDTNQKTPEKSIGRLKSEKRAEQRMARLEAMRWYGFSAARPTAAAMPFTSMYSPAWTRAGGRPFAWYTGERPVIVPRYYYYR